MSKSTKRLNAGSANWLALIIFLFVVTVIFINIFNRPEPNENPSPSSPVVTQTEQPPEQNAIPESAPHPPPDAGLSGEANAGIIKKTFVLRGADYTENVFYKDGREVARQSISPQGQLINQTGEIPDGRIKFIDEYNRTTGEEQYINGKRFGKTKTLYSDGVLKSEEKYLNDKLIYKREYFHDGKLRSSCDYEDTRTNLENKENGIGKLYYPSGVLKYEWYLTRREAVGFRKSYNPDGTLRAETYFDEHNNVIPNPHPVVPPAPAPVVEPTPVSP